MLRPISTEVEKLMFLRDVIIPFVKEREDDGQVNFSIFDCGTHKCLLGWAFNRFYIELEVPKLGLGHYFEAKKLIAERLGLTDNDLLQLFSPVGALQERSKYLDNIINRKITEAVGEQG